MALSSINLYDTFGNPVSGATVAFLKISREGDLLDAGVADDLTDGCYGVTLTDEEESDGVIILYDATGTGLEPEYSVDAVALDGLQAFLLLEEDGDLYGGPSEPAWGVYVDGEGDAVTPPAFTMLDTYLAITTIPPAHLRMGIAARIDLPAGIDPPKLGANFSSRDTTDVTPPVVTLISPPASSTIEPTTPLILEVEDDHAIRRSILTAQLADAEEVVHNGDRFASRYASSSRSPIAGGWRYVIRRTGGWPVGPTITVYAIDTAGQEAS